MSTFPYPAPAPSRVLRLPRLSRGGAQVALFFLAYLVYSGARYFTIGDLGDATANAHWIVDLEDSLHVGIEGAVQTALTGTVALWILNHVYLAAQLVVLPGALWFLHRTARPAYARLRNTIVATWLLSIPVYGLFPVAPPRLADVGLVDTISSQTGFAMDSSLTTSFYNELAAVPSLHVGFAFAISVAAAAALRAPWARALALLWGPLVTLSVVATGNHYLFDVVAGLLVTAVGFAAGRLPARLEGVWRLRRLTLQGAST
jgi:membrane-associated phospholipid phosphatase